MHAHAISSRLPLAYHGRAEVAVNISEAAPPSNLDNCGLCCRHIPTVLTRHCVARNSQDQGQPHRRPPRECVSEQVNSARLWVIRLVALLPIRRGARQRFKAAAVGAAHVLIGRRAGRGAPRHYDSLRLVVWAIFACFGRRGSGMWPRQGLHVLHRHLKSC